MAAKHQKIWIDNLPKTFGPAERIAIGKDIVDFIRAHTAKGLDPNKPGNKEFKNNKYSPEYVKSLDFSIAGKSKSKVNLRLSGDMMADLDLISHKSGAIQIGFQAGTESNAKADGNIRGTYGKKTPDADKARNFLGINKKHLDAIIKKYSKKNIEVTFANKAAKQAALNEVDIKRDGNQIFIDLAGGENGDS